MNHGPVHCFIKRASRKLLLRLRQLAIGIGFDPMIRYNLDGLNLRLPLSHNLPLYRRTFPLYSSNVGRVAAAVATKYHNMHIIDIGANIGDTVAIVRSQVNCPILCVEGDASFFDILQRNTEPIPSVSLEYSFVGIASELMNVTLERLSGTARLMQSAKTSSDIGKIRRLREILEDHPSFAECKLLKIDTDGLDGAIIRSERAFLTKVCPVLFFEYDPDAYAPFERHWTDTFQALEASGYQRLMLYENTGDFITTIDISAKDALEDFHHFYLGRASLRYCDICAFHRGDSDLADSFRKSELEFFRSVRGSTARSRRVDACA
jgi:FkbM family methyltransferase